jgi:hypothetical protein
MSDAVPIIFFHSKEFPRYLYKTMESARFFNPESPIYFITDIEGVDLSALGVNFVTKAELAHGDLDEFRRRYVHIADLKEDYIRICTERWFFINELQRQRGLGRCAYLDSDGMLFHDLRRSFAEIDPVPNILCSQMCGPALTFIQRPIQGFVDFILDRYEDQPFLDRFRRLNAEAKAKGGMFNLDDMALLQAYGEADPKNLAAYPNDLPIGHIDHCIYVETPDQGDIATVPVRRHGYRKRIFWEDRGGAFLPSFRRASTGALYPALFVHFQNGAKRRIQRFNPVGGGGLVPRNLRRAWFNWKLN